MSIDSGVSVFFGFYFLSIYLTRRSLMRVMRDKSFLAALLIYLKVGLFVGGEPEVAWGLCFVSVHVADLGLCKPWLRLSFFLCQLFCSLREKIWLIGRQDPTNSLGPYPPMISFKPRGPLLDKYMALWAGILGVWDSNNPWAMNFQQSSLPNFWVKQTP